MPSLATAPRLLSSRRNILLLLCLVAGVGAVALKQKRRIEDFGTKPEVHSGPWGELEEFDLRLEQPEEYVGFEKTTADGPFWSFGSITEPALRAKLAETGLSDSQITRLLTARVPGTGGVVIIKPTTDLILELSPELRSNLYLLLAYNPVNRFQSSPYVIPRGGVSKVFEGHDLVTVEMRRLVERLSYRRNGFLYFSDPETVLKIVPNLDDAVRLDFLKALTGQNVVQARILVRPDGDIDKPLHYWGLAAPWVLVKDLKPLFESVRRLPQGGGLSLLYVLPPLARDRLMTSTLPPSSAGGALPDCHWSALNFFAMNPDPKMANTDFASAYIAKNFYEIGKPGLEGDLVLLLNSRNQVLHSSVYIAHDIVFTKNGINFAQPWVTMRIPDMVAEFSALEPVRVAYFRRRDM